MERGGGFGGSRQAHEGEANGHEILLGGVHGKHQVPEKRSDLGVSGPVIHIGSKCRNTVILG